MKSNYDKRTATPQGASGPVSGLLRPPPLATLARGPRNDTVKEKVRDDTEVKCGPVMTLGVSPLSHLFPNHEQGRGNEDGGIGTEDDAADKGKGKELNSSAAKKVDGEKHEQGGERSV